MCSRGSYLNATDNLEVRTMTRGAEEGWKEKMRRGEETRGHIVIEDDELGINKDLIAIDI